MHLGHDAVPEDATLTGSKEPLRGGEVEMDYTIKQLDLLRAVAEAAERVWDTVPAEYGGAKAMVHARALNDMRDALIAAREGGAL